MSANPHNTDKKMSESLREIYESYFDIRHEVDDSPDFLAESFRLRYQVYCLEHDFENPDEFRDEQEKDRFDDRAYHSLVIHRTTGMVVGAVRLIRTDPDFRHYSLPIDALCTDLTLHDELVLPRARLVEASRFAITKEFRRRVEDAPTPTGVGPGWRESKDRRRRVPHPSLGLFQAMVCICKRHGLTHWVAEMEPALLRMLRSLGIHFVNIGPVVEFHGRRQPCYIDLAEMLRQAELQRPDVWGLITADGQCA